MTNRKSIPDRIATTVLFESDRKCCICHKEGRAVQVHHLDGDNTNNELDNLAALCLEHHHEASTRSSIGRKLSSSLIKKYRSDWYKIVRKKRSAKAKSLERETGNSFLDSIAVHDVRKILFRLNPHEWDKQEDILRELFLYVEDYSIAVRHEIVSGLAKLTVHTRFKMLPSVGKTIGRLVCDLLPFISLVHPIKKFARKNEIDLLISATNRGFEMAYDGIKYCNNITTVDAGLSILWDILRYSHLNNDVKIKKYTLEHFDQLKELAQKVKFEDAIKWTEFMKEDALALNHPLPKLPGDVIAKIKS